MRLAWASAQTHGPAQAPHEAAWCCCRCRRPALTGVQAAHPAASPTKGTVAQVWPAVLCAATLPSDSCCSPPGPVSWGATGCARIVLEPEISPENSREASLLLP